MPQSLGGWAVVRRVAAGRTQPEHRQGPAAAGWRAHPEQPVPVVGLRARQALPTRPGEPERPAAPRPWMALLVRLGAEALPGGEEFRVTLRRDRAPQVGEAPHRFRQQRA